jgi:transposase-like protein
MEGRGSDTAVTRPFSIPYKQRMIERMTGKDASSARQVARETGISQETLSRWLREAHSLPLMERGPETKRRSIEEKIRILAEAGKLSGGALTGYLEREGLLLADIEQWRLALDDEGHASKATTKRIRKLERELARKEKALAEAAALLVLKKKVEHLYQEDEDGDTDEENEK